MGVRAKMKCDEITQRVNWSNSDKPMEIVKLRAVSDGSPENKRWAAASPSGTFEIQIDNPDALKQFKVGKSYFIDINEVVDDQPDALGAVPASVPQIG